MVGAVAVARGKQIDPTRLLPGEHKATAGFTGTGPTSPDAKEDLS